MHKENDMESLEEFVVSILEDGIHDREVYGSISRWSKEDPFWCFFLMRDEKEGQACGGHSPLNITDIGDLTKVLSLFSNQKRKIIVDTEKYFD